MGLCVDQWVVKAVSFVLQSELNTCWFAMQNTPWQAVWGWGQIEKTTHCWTVELRTIFVHYESVFLWIQNEGLDGFLFSKLQAPLQVQCDLTPEIQRSLFCSEALGMQYNTFGATCTHTCSSLLPCLWDNHEGGMWSNFEEVDSGGFMTSSRRMRLLSELALLPNWVIAVLRELLC